MVILDRALEFCQLRLERTPDDVESLKQAARIHAKARRYGEALAHLDRALGVDRSRSELWVEKADVHLLAKNQEEELRCIEVAVKAGSMDVSILVRYGDLLARVCDDVLAAESVFRQAVESDPENALAWYNLGASLQMQEKLGDALGAFEKAVGIAPDFALALNSMGTVYARAGLLQEATAAYQRAIAADQRYARPWFNLGQVYEVTGQRERAVKAYERAFAIDPEHALARTALDRLVASRSSDTARGLQGP